MKSFRVFAMMFCLAVLPKGAMLVGQDEDSTSSTKIQKSEAYQRVLLAIQQSKLAAAEKLLDYELKQSPHDLEIWMLRRALANAYFRIGKRSEADVQLEQIVDYIFKNPNQSRKLLKYLPQILVSISYIQLGQEPRTSRILAKVIPILSDASEQSPTNSAISGALSSAVNMKARALIKSGQQSQALTLYRDELKRLRDNRNRRTEDPFVWLQLAYNLKAAYDTIGDGFEAVTLPWRWERTNVLQTCVKLFPQSHDLVNVYFEEKLLTIAEYEQVYPPIVAGLYAETREQLAGAMQQNEFKKPFLNLRLKLEKSANKFNRNQIRKSLCGNKMPQLASIDWLVGKPAGVGNESVLMFIDFKKTNLDTVVPLLRDLVGQGTHDCVLVVPETRQSFKWLLEGVKRSRPNSEQLQRYRQTIRKKFSDNSLSEIAIGIAKDSEATANLIGIVELPTIVAVSEKGLVKRVYSGTDSLKTFIEDSKTN